MYIGRNVYNTPRKSTRRNIMPIFIMHQWGNCHVRLAPSDVVRNSIREALARHDVIPYFFGPITFDLVVAVPKKQYKIQSNQKIKYQWYFCDSQNDTVIKSAKEIMRLSSSGVFKYRKSSVGQTAHYGFDISPFGRNYKRLRKSQAIDLGHVSKLGQYRIEMQFENDIGETSDRMIMLEFSLLDRDNFSINIISLLIGAGIGIVAGIIGYILGVN